MKALVALGALALAGAARGATAPADPWPRAVATSDALLLVYQPQAESWTGNTLTFRAVVSARPNGAGDEALGVVLARARTQVDKVSRIVSLEDVTLIKRDFPGVSDNGASYLLALRKGFGPGQRTISLDRVEASLAAAAAAKPAAVAVANDPPRILVSETPAILVPIDGAPVLRALPRTNFQRVVNTRALILAAAGAPTLYLHVYDGWLSSDAIAGPWRLPAELPPGIDAVARQIAVTGIVDLLDGVGVRPKPTLASGVPTIAVSEVPAELIVFQGPPAFVPIPGTGIQRAANTAADVFLDPSARRHYVLLSGRWFSSPGLTGPWSYVSGASLPADFRRIPADSPAGVVLAAVPGTPQAEEALIANMIPETATVKRVGGPTFAPRFDGEPQLARIAGTSMKYVVNSPTPIIEVDANRSYALRAGIWFMAPSITGPWLVADDLPSVISTIPPTSPLHFVTYAQIYGVTAAVVYVGYTPGYLGTVVSPDGVVVYGTGYPYTPWVGSVWYPTPATYGAAAQPLRNPPGGSAFAFAMGVTTPAVVGATAYYNPYPYPLPYYHPYPYSTAEYHPYDAAYGTTSASVYGQYGDAATYGTRSYFSEVLAAGDLARGQSSAATGRYDDLPAPAAAAPAAPPRSAAIEPKPNTYGDGAPNDRPATTPEIASAATGRSETTFTDPKTGQTSAYPAAGVADDYYADRNGQVFAHAAGAWRQRTATGWTDATSDTAAPERESQARRAGDARFGNFARGAAASDSGGWTALFGASDGSPRPSGGGAGWGDRYGESAGLPR